MTCQLPKPQADQSRSIAAKRCFVVKSIVRKNDRPGRNEREAIALRKTHCNRLVIDVEDDAQILVLEVPRRFSSLTFATDAAMMYGI